MEAHSLSSSLGPLLEAFDLTVERVYNLELIDLVLGPGSAICWLCVLEQVPFYLWALFPHLENVNLIMLF